MGTLTLHLDDDLIHRAEVCSETTGRSLSEVVADYLAEFSSQPPTKRTEERLRTSAAEATMSSEQRAQHQYHLAHRYPGEFVVLVEDEVFYHSANRQAAFEAYDRAFVDSPSGRPAIVDPARRLQRRPVVRGRSLKKVRST